MLVLQRIRFLVQISQGSDFSKSSLVSTRISNSSFTHSDFSKAVFNDLISEKCHFNFGDFVKSHIIDSKFYQTNFIGVKFDYFQFGNCEFYNGNMSGSRFNFAAVEPFTEEAMINFTYSSLPEACIQSKNSVILNGIYILVIR